ncbi:hypothetical protein FAP39_03565 [Shimia litoralis]|uniref:DUF1801 domain-containing protein n=1 Tax=Shimia litoralis TaxID=420403 RepID=A0A4V6F3A4_9RHOB|nr:hypothetical protein [Shimia litoralis]TKZ21691.1 hypothetical protein FAP39_03565 [Shimia litoralis]
MTMWPELPKDVQAVVRSWPSAAQSHFYTLRDILWGVAAADPAIGHLSEALRWGEPSFLTKQSGSGTTLRISWSAKHPDDIGIYVICRTDMLEQVRSLYPDSFRYVGTRGAMLSLNSDIPEDAVAFCGQRAFTYHLSG